MSATRIAALLLPLLIWACSSPQILTEVLPPLDQRSVERGAQLANGLAACGYCHGSKAEPGSALIGGREQFDKYGPVRAANITSAASGLADWQALDIVRAVRSSLSKSEEQLSNEVHRGYEWMSDQDLYSIIAYLKSLPPEDNIVERRSLSFVDRNTTGFFDKRREVEGLVPEVPPGRPVEYGEYLVNHVARCTRCHNSPESLLETEGYLVGGKTIENEFGSKVAPGISGSEIYGIGSWSEAQLVHFLQTGSAPDGKEIDSHFCPIEFYKQAEQSDLEAIAKFLKTVDS